MDAYGRGDYQKFYEYNTRIAAYMPEQFGYACMDNSNVEYIVNDFLGVLDDFKNDYGNGYYVWNAQSKQNYEDNKWIVDGWGSLMDPAWDHGLYFQAGQFYGLMAEIVLDFDKDSHPLPITE